MGRGEHLEEKQPTQRPRGERRPGNQEALNEELCGCLEHRVQRGQCIYIRPGGSCGSELSGNGGHIRDLYNFARTNGKSFKGLNIVHMCVIRLF